MTVVAAIAESGATHFASDDLIVDDRDTALTSMRKTFVLHGVLFGFSGSIAADESVRKAVVDAHGGDVEGWLRNVVVPAWRRSLEADGRKMDGSYLVGTHGMLWLVGGDMLVIRLHGGRHAIGSGADFARGALHALRHRPAREALQAACDAAQACVPGIGSGRRFEWA